MIRWPNYMVIGAAKCGTTSVCELLAAHPNVFMTRPREPHFFSREDIRPEEWDWYRGLFADATEDFRGEGSTSYTKPAAVELAASRIGTHLPDCKLIYMVRHPIARLESDWKMRSQQGQWNYESINEAVLNEPKIVWHGLYWKYLNTYRQYFHDDQLLVVFLKDFAADPDEQLRRIFGHIGADPAIKVSDLESRRNRAEDRRQHGRLLRLLRSTGVFTSIRKALPDWSVKPLKGLLTRQTTPPQIEWDPAVRSEVAAAFEEDSKRLLAHLGKPTNFWEFP